VVGFCCTVWLFAVRCADLAAAARALGAYTVASQDNDPGSFLNLYRAALALRPALWVDAGDVRWLTGPPAVLALARGAAQCWVNTGDVDVDLPEGYEVVLASVDGVDSALPPDVAAWLVAS
jgi:alpha-glucosidase